MAKPTIPLQRLYILYDEQCAFCRQCRVWLAQQPAFVTLTFVPLQSPEAECRFPGLKRLHPEAEMVVISDRGDVWQGGAAWIMCLWALREYREWSQRLAHPALRPLARRLCEVVSANRFRLSRWLSEETTHEQLREKLAAFPATSCANTGYRKTRS